ncbi:hypothetical protein DFQ30_005823 [Apophysomyces sp. BC1015]|nr:hypothetical protein DFQ30_005823 [Apophysomyces sp. BC1015]KAG0177501.1 hypothetical protein DFQ29_004774 [Apophysomyces sp. BC1021]
MKSVGQLKETYLDDTAIDDALFQNIVSILRKFKDKPRKQTKSKLMALALDANLDDLDANILDVLLNCFKKLTEYQNDMPAGGQQLITSYIDPNFP